MNDTKPYYTIMTAKDREIEAEIMAHDSMGSTCSDCGHTCGEDTMTNYCKGWSDALKESRKSVRQLVSQEQADLTAAKAAVVQS